MVRGSPVNSGVCVTLNIRQVRSLCYFSSVGFMIEKLAVDSGVYLCMNTIFAIIVAWLNASQ